MNPKSKKTEDQPAAEEESPAGDSDDQAVEAEGVDAPTPETEDAEEEAAEAPTPETDDDTSDEYPDFETALATAQDKLLRALAEAENVRRRGEREKVDASKYAIAAFAREMLSVTDNLRRALDSVDADARANDAALDTLMIGVEMTEREMSNAFDKVGISPIEALGQPFDHNVHQAMFELDDPSQPAGTVVQVLQGGYMLHDRLLRPAQVGVSKGGPKTVPADAETAENQAQGEAEADEKPADGSVPTIDEPPTD